MTFLTISVSPVVIWSGKDLIAGDAWISSYVAGRSACFILNLNIKKRHLIAFLSSFLTYNQTISCCNSVDKFVGGSGTHVIMVVIIPNAFILANGCWPVAISNYRISINIYLKKTKFFLFTVDKPNAHISDRIP